MLRVSVGRDARTYCFAAPAPAAAAAAAADAARAATVLESISKCIHQKGGTQEPTLISPARS